MLGLLFLWWRSFKSGKTSHHLERKISRTEPMHFLFCFILFYFHLLRRTLWNQISWTLFGRWGSVNACGATVSVFVCTGEPGQGCRPGCWLRKPRILYLREEGIGKWQTQGCTFEACLFSPVEAACEPFYFIHQPTHSFINYFPNPYYTRHLKRGTFLKRGVWNSKGK